MPATHCPICNEKLEDMLDQLMGVCQNPFCRGPFFRQSQLASEAAEEQARWASAERTLAECAPQIESYACSSSSQSLPSVIAIVPASNARLIPQTEERRQQFLDHLDRSLATAIEFAGNEEKLARIEAEFEYRKATPVAPTPLAVINACTTCRGFCCHQSGINAFLTPEFFTWQLVNNRALTPELLRESYASYLPSESQENSCIFHAIDGCSLPREMRNNICNDYICHGLRDVANSFEMSQPLVNIAVAVANSQPVRIGMLSTEAARVELEVSPTSAGDAAGTIPTSTET